MKKILNFILECIRFILGPQYRVYLYLGFPGDGKSTTAAHIAKKAMKKHIPVWSNCSIKGTYKLDPRNDLGKYLIYGGCVIIDEAGLEYDNRDYAKFPEKTKKFLKKHRKHHCNVYFFSQDEDIDKKIRKLTKQIFIVQRSFIPLFISRYTISRHWVVDELTHSVIQADYRVPLSRRLIFAPSTWSLFDTDETNETLPEKEWEKW